MIPLTHWIPDELHLMLHITDRLWSLMLEETEYKRNESIREKIKEMSMIRVHFEFWQNQVQITGTIPVLWEKIR